jgi:hypothetical protein
LGPGEGRNAESIFGEDEGACTTALNSTVMIRRRKRDRKLNGHKLESGKIPNWYFYATSMPIRAGIAQAPFLLSLHGRVVGKREASRAFIGFVDGYLVYVYVLLEFGMVECRLG